MFKNYLKIGFRHLWQNRLYSIINIAGLTVGITCMLLAVLYWKDERSFDNFHKNNPNLFRVTTTLVETKDAKAITLGGSGQVQGPAFKDEVPELVSYVRILGGDIYSDVVSENKLLRLKPLFVDADFFDVFTFHLLRGNPKTVLSEINSVVISESTARKYFNSIDVVGKPLRMDADPSFDKLGKSLIISGVVEDPPSNSSLQFDCLFTFSFMHLSFEDDNWLNAYLGTFVVLHPGTDKRLVEQKFNKIYAFHAKEQLAINSKTFGFDPQISYGLQQITNIHLNPLMRTGGDAEGGIVNTSDPAYSYICMGIALFILLMAIINFINISIADSMKRAKEIGVRKIAGGNRKQIIMQFLNESAILCFIAFLLSLVLMNISLPLFISFSGKQLLFPDALDYKLAIYFIVILVFVALFTGFYPAYLLSKFKPITILSNKLRLSGGNAFGRILVIVQFTLAMVLLIASIVYYDQMNYIRTKDLGYNPNRIIRTAVSGDRDYNSIITYLKNELVKEPSVKMVSFGGYDHNDRVNVNNRHFEALHKTIDENYLLALEIPLQAGRNFSPAFSNDKKDAAIVNEVFMKTSGLDNPIGTQIMVNESYNSKMKTIVGVVKDFHFGSLREPIKPMVMYMPEMPEGVMWVKFEKSKQKEAIAVLAQAYKKSMPGAVFHYDFLNEMNARQYVQEQQLQRVISVATVLSLIICCLGLFGLAHLSAIQRQKEIGVRRALGASVKQIVFLLSGNFLELVLVAYVIAAPIAWLVMNKWLENFSYRISIELQVFVFTGLLAIIIVFITVSFHAIKAAIVNPVKSLRNE